MTHRLNTRLRYIEQNAARFTVTEENLYIIHSSVKSINARFTKDKKLNEKLSAYLDSVSYKVTDENFFGYFANSDFSVKEIYALRSALYLLLTEKTVTEMQNGNRELLTDTVLSFRAVKTINTEKCFALLCRAEKMLCRVTDGYTKNTKDSKNRCREAVMRYSEKHGVDDIAGIIGMISKNRSVYSFAEAKTVPPFFWFFVCFPIFAFFTSVSLVLGFSAGTLFAIASVLSAFPIYIAASGLTDFLFSRVITAKPPLRLELTEVPESSPVCTVITTLLFGKEKDEKIFTSLEECFLRNRKGATVFGVLADLPDSSVKENDSDTEIIGYAEKRINELNAEYGNKFCLFIRERKLNADGIYTGYERKRGAVCDIIRRISGENVFFKEINGEKVQGAEYLLTLDGDTELPPDGITELLGVALHPQYKPVCENGKVISGYAVFQPAIRTGLRSVGSTYYTLLKSEEPSLYESASYDRWQNVLGSGGFCGKGLINVSLFGKLILPHFPENRILSHDIPEGSVLRCMYVPDTVCTDSSPKNAVSYFKRLHRWIRGDIQNLWFINKNILGKYGKYKIIDTAIRDIAPVFSAAGILLCAFSSESTVNRSIAMLLLLESHNAVNAAVTFFSRITARSYTPRRFFTKAFSGTIKSIGGLIFEIYGIFEYARTAADALFRSVYRMFISHKNMLEWVTFGVSDAADNDFSGHILAFPTSIITGMILLFVSTSAVFRTFGLILFLFPAVSYVFSKKIPSSAPRITEKQKRIFGEYASDAYGFFRDRVGKDTAYLPPDNIQLSPSYITAYRTSPTNIGFYLLGLLASYDFGFTEKKELIKRVSKTLDTVERMEKCHGHLYNWYSLPDLSVIGNGYVSSVDSGNFVTMLSILAEGLKEIGTGEADALSKRAERICENTDFSFLFNFERNLFYIGYSKKNGYDGICYDLLMSEMRTVSYYAVAVNGVPKSHWRELSRAIISDSGFIGMASWAGTAFEYFMPELFLPTPENSFLDESSEFALHAQMNFQRHGIWGVSESGYHAFDGEMNYRYKSHGVPSVALKKYGRDEFVVSPYSTFLMAHRAPGSAISNLERIKSEGMYGEYGFYEALDMSRSPYGTVKSYMAHHTGMILVACANICFDGIFRRRFIKNRVISAYRSLLEESIPKSVVLYPTGEYVKSAYSRQIVNSETIPFSPDVRIYGNGNISVIASSDGRIIMKNGNYIIADSDRSDIPEKCGMLFGFDFGDRTEIINPFYSNPESFSFEENGKEFAFVSSSPKNPAIVKVGAATNGKVFRFSTRAERGSFPSVCIMFEPILDTKEHHYPSPAYSKLFVISRFDENERIVFFSRKSEGGTRYPICAVTTEDKEMRFSFATDMSALYSNGYDPGFLFSAELKNNTGVCINPVCIIKTEPVKGGETAFLIASAYTEKECVSAIKDARKKSVKGKSADSEITKSVSSEARRIISRVLFPQCSAAMSDAGIPCLWKAGVSGDFPLIAIKVENQNTNISNVLEAFSALIAASERTELLFLTKENGGYSSAVENSVVNAVNAFGLSGFLSARGGIFIADQSAFNDDETAFIKYYSSVFIPDETADAKQIYGILPKSRRAGYTVGKETVKSGSVTVSGDFRMPRSFILAGKSAVSVVTHKTLGFTAYHSARDGRISFFDTDPYRSYYGERLFIFGETPFDCIQNSMEVRYSPGCAEYAGRFGETVYLVTVAVHPRLPVKCIRLTASNEIKSGFMLMPEAERTAFIIKNGVISFSVPKSNPPFYGFVYAENAEYTADESEFFGIGKSGVSDFACATVKKTDVCFYVGGAEDIQSVYEITDALKKYQYDFFIKEAKDFALSFIPPQTIFTENEFADELYRVFVPYQTAFSRFIGRTGFSQTGGAYGFRDQLQDSLAIIYSRPDEVRRHIIRASSHQYKEGDVMHWFTESGYGLRTECSDDLLFLPLTVADYISKTGDIGILYEEAPFLTSPALDGTERYEKPESEESGTIYSHCMRALTHSAGKIGEHGMSLFGSCDWNDGMNKVGTGGIGESMFTTEFLGVVCREFAPLCRKVGDNAGFVFLNEEYDRIRKTVLSLFDNDRFPRGTFDNGTFFGVKSSEECSIDLITQAFSAVLLGKTNETVTAINTAYDILFNTDNGVFALLYPPFDKIDAGYISAYPAGVRENGGQYTHGALWGVWGLALCGEYEKAIKTFERISPPSLVKNAEYGLESYMIPADVSPSGKGGWSFYTGSAAWWYKILTEVIMGISFTENFTKISVKPLCEFVFVSFREDIKLKIISSHNEETATIDGMPAVFPIKLSAGEHIIRVRSLTNNKLFGIITENDTERKNGNDT